MNEIHSSTVCKVGFHRGSARIWLQGRKPAQAGFVPQVRFRPVKDEKRLRLTLVVDPHGSRIVSRKAASDGQSFIPVIDINQNELLAMFYGMDSVRVIMCDGEIIIEALHSAKRLKERLERVKGKLVSGTPLSVGSLSLGAGILSKAIHDGLQAGGISTRLRFVNDICETYIEQAARANPVWRAETVALSMPLQELAFDKDVMNSLPQIDVLDAGLPCEFASKSGRAKNKTICAEAHPEVGHLVAPFLALVAQVNPAILIVENVEIWLGTASRYILEKQLRDFGYEVSFTTVHANDWGVLENRVRMCLVAHSVGMSFSLDELTPPMKEVPSLGEIMDDVPLDDAMWSSMDYLVQKEARDIQAGKNFAMKVHTGNSTSIGVCGRGYRRRRSTEPKIQHPLNPKLLRLLTVNEQARSMGVDPALVAGLCDTTASQLLGQGVCPLPFEAVAKLIAASFRKLVELPVAAVEPLSGYRQNEQSLLPVQQRQQPAAKFEQPSLF